MSHAGRLMGRLFSLGLSCLLGLSAARAQTPALTTVSDTVYRADGAPASGTLLISWPAFTTADGHAVAAGTKSVPLASNGSFSLQLALNAGGTPGVTYAVVYQLSDGTVKSEFWSVGTASPETSEAVRVTGGKCSGNGQGGTLRFTTVNSHAVGYTIASASGGLQEALVAARFTPSNPTGTTQSGKVIVPPGELKAYARVSIRASNVTVDFSASIVECWMNDTCIYVGETTGRAK